MINSAVVFIRWLSRSECRIGNIDKAYQLCQDGIAAIPYDEHAYRSKAELEISMNRGEAGVEKAIVTLTSALEKGLSASQCATRLFQLFFDKGEFQKAINAATRAIMDSAEDQPSIATASIIAKRGFAYDKLYSKNKMIGKTDYILAKSAIKDYKMALALVGSSIGHIAPITMNQILVRLSILEEEVSEAESEDTDTENN